MTAARVLLIAEGVSEFGDLEGLPPGGKRARRRARGYAS